MAFLLAAPAAVDPATRAIDHKEACETLCPELVISAGGHYLSQASELPADRLLYGRSLLCSHGTRRCHQVALRWRS